MSQISISAAKITEGPVSSIRKKIYFAVTLSAPAGQEVTVDYILGGSKDSAVKGVDYVDTSGQIAILAGQVSAYIGIDIIGNALFEKDKTFSLILNNPTGASFGKNITSITGTGTIKNDEQTVSIGAGSINEGNAGLIGKIYFPVTLSAPATQDVSMLYSTTNSTGKAPATADVDYTSATGLSFTILAGQTYGYIGIDIPGDALNEEDELFNLVLSNLTGAAFSKGDTLTAIGTIKDDDSSASLPPIALTIIPAKSIEGVYGVATQAVFTMMLSSPQTTSVSVGFTTKSPKGANVAIAGKDYVALSGTLIFAAGETIKTINIDLIDDHLKESDETFNLVLSKPNGAGFSTGVTLTSIGTILDNEPILSASNASVLESNAGEISVIHFPVMLSEASDVPVSLQYKTSSIKGAASSKMDYFSKSGSLTFEVGETFKYIDITIKGDGVKENAETFNVVLSKPVSAGLDSATGTSITLVGSIIDNEAIFYV
jgi:hypothetical protein